MTMSEDMLAESLVPSLSRPSGNTTGVSSMLRVDNLIE
jgi:ABC-type uncharacterized transport system substrate-binding protein